MRQAGIWRRGSQVDANNGTGLRGASSSGVSPSRRGRGERGCPARRLRTKPAKRKIASTSRTSEAALVVCGERFVTNLFYRETCNRSVEGEGERMGLPSGRPAREAFEGGSPEGSREGVRFSEPSKGVNLSWMGHKSGKPLLVKHRTPLSGKRLLRIQSPLGSFHKSPVATPVSSHWHGCKGKLPLLVEAVASLHVLQSRRADQARPEFGLVPVRCLNRFRRGDPATPS